MDRKQAVSIASFFCDVLLIPAIAFRLPRRKVAEGEDAPPPVYAVSLNDGATLLGSAEQARTLLNGE